MTLMGILDIADKAIPGGRIAEQVDGLERGGKIVHFEDCLALLVVKEISRTYDKEDTADQQIRKAVAVIEKAMQDLDAVRDALYDSDAF